MLPLAAADSWRVAGTLQLAACVDMSVELSEAALSFIRSGIEAAAAKAQVQLAVLQSLGDHPCVWS